MEKDLVLGKQVDYKYIYDVLLLQPIERAKLMFTDDSLDIYGWDCWNMYELSWLNHKGMPQVSVGEVYIPCQSKYIIESKSFKLYLNSFNQTRFNSWNEVKSLLTKDLSKAVGEEVVVYLYSLDMAPHSTINNFEGICIDQLDLEIDHNGFSENHLKYSLKELEGKFCVYSNLLKSNCLITHQPDWGSIIIEYEGKEISADHILRYLISFRQHNEFHEQCVERIYRDIKKFCNPRELSVYARYTRRGGLDINPYRSSKKIDIEEMIVLNKRLVRQ